MSTSHPDRFDGFAPLPMSDPTAAAAEMRRAVTELGLTGAVVIHGRTGPVNLDDPRSEPIWAAAAQLHAPIYVRTTRPGWRRCVSCCPASSTVIPACS